MAIINGWLDWAVKMPAPAHKVYDKPNSGAGICLHSAECERPVAIRIVMDKTNEKSWMFFVDYWGEVLQHYPITGSTWTSGNWLANTTLWAIEMEGYAGQPINELQTMALQRIFREWMDLKGKQLVRVGERSLWEHNEVAKWALPNAGGTACPSGRYNSIYGRIPTYQPPIEEPPVTDYALGIQNLQEEQEALRTAVTALLDKSATQEEVAAGDDISLKAVQALNLAVMQRMDLINLASGPIEKVRDAHGKLSGLGLVTKR